MFESWQRMVPILTVQLVDLLGWWLGCQDYQEVRVELLYMVRDGATAGGIFTFMH